MSRTLLTLALVALGCRDVRVVPNDGGGGTTPVGGQGGVGGEGLGAAGGVSPNGGGGAGGVEVVSEPWVDTFTFGDTPTMFAPWRDGFVISRRTIDGISLIVSDGENQTLNLPLAVDVVASNSEIAMLVGGLNDSSILFAYPQRALVRPPGAPREDRWDRLRSGAPSWRNAVQAEEPNREAGPVRKRRPCGCRSSRS